MDLARVGVFSARNASGTASPASAWRDLRVRATPAKLVGGTEAARLLKAKRAAAWSCWRFLQLAAVLRRRTFGGGYATVIIGGTC